MNFRKLDGKILGRNINEEGFGGCLFTQDAR